MEHNCLRKRTAATRKLSLQRLSELYGLDARIVLFRVLRDLWGRHETSRPLLALLLALARDPLLRATARAVVATPFGHEFARQSMKDTLSDAVGDRLNDATLDNVGVKRGEGGTEDRLAAGLTLQKRLVAILEGQPPLTSLSAEPISEQPIGWEPDINDGVRQHPSLHGPGHSWRQNRRWDSRGETEHSTGTRTAVRSRCARGSSAPGSGMPISSAASGLTTYT